MAAAEAALAMQIAATGKKAISDFGDDDQSSAAAAAASASASAALQPIWTPFAGRLRV